MFERLIRQRDYLLDISRTLTSRLSLSDVLRNILASATEMLAGHAGLIGLAQQDTFTLRASYGINPLALPLFTPLLTDIRRDANGSLVIPKLSQKLRAIAQAARMGLQQVVALPMIIGEELVGVIFVFREYGVRFTANEVKLLQSFADQAAIAVQNARLYEEVVAEKKRLDAILRYSADGIMILNQYQRVESINLALGRMLYLEEGSAHGIEHGELIRWARLREGISLEAAVAQGWPLGEQSELHNEGELKRRDGGHVSVGITYVPLFDREGRLDNVIASVRDITRFREAEQAKSVFISMISHELKTPVSLIKGYADTLRRDDVEWDRQTVVHGLNIIEEESNRLAELIDNLLDASRLQAGMLHLKWEFVALDRFVDELIETFKVQVANRPIQFVLEFPPDFPQVQVDRQRIGQVVRNLLSNAIKYSPRGGVIRISGRALDDGVEIAFADEGIGLSEEQIEHIFDPFYRVDNALSRETEGAGLGLSIVQSIVEAHHGLIKVKSKVGAGTTFTLWLPLLQD